jgi:hypothetical protein
MIEAYPEAASIIRTALHLACMNGFSLVIVQRLYQLYPEAIMAQYYLNSLPLHLLTARYLLELYPGGIRAADTVGALAGFHFTAHMCF